MEKLLGQRFAGDGVFYQRFLKKRDCCADGSPDFFMNVCEAERNYDGESVIMPCVSAAMKVFYGRLGFAFIKEEFF